MKGYLSYLVLWILKKEPLRGSEIASELKKRRGKKPSPGTIYPVLKELKQKGLINSDKEKKYALTKKGEQELISAVNLFCTMFYDIHDMFQCCCKKK